MRELISSDFFRFYASKNSYKTILRLFILEPTFRYLVLFRLCKHYSKNNLIGFFSRLWYFAMRGRFGIQIYLGAEIGYGFKINHYGNIIINQGVKIGNNCNVAQGVTIGNVSRGKLRGTPLIGDRVWIGPNAVVVGNIQIGNDVLIAPLTYVNCNLPDNAVVSGNPCKIHNYNGSEVYVKNIYPIL